MTADLDSTSTTAARLDVLAHDLRNRLNVLSTGVQLLADDSTEPLAEEVRVASRDLGALIDRLVEGARAEVGEGLDPEAVDVEALVGSGIRRALRDWGAEVEGEALGAVWGTAATFGPGAERVVADAVARCAWEGTRAIVECPEPLVVTVRSGPPMAPTRPTPKRSERVVLAELMASIADGAGIALDDDPATSVSIELRFAPSPTP